MNESVGADEAEERLGELPGAGPLDEAASRRFLRTRRRIHRHHSTWRDGMPTLDSLFDDDTHRARALAGNLCTELEDVLLAWGEIRAEVGPPDPEAREFVRESSRAWKRAALDLGAAHEWDREAREVFGGVLDDLVARAVHRGEAALAGEARSGPPPPARWQLWLRRVVRAPLIALRRFLRPDGA